HSSDDTPALPSFPTRRSSDLRANLLAKLASGESPFPGVVGFDESVLPALERGILAGHDLILLGERGQAKTRLVRHLVNLMDAETDRKSTRLNSSHVKISYAVF